MLDPKHVRGEEIKPTVVETFREMGFTAIMVRRRILLLTEETFQSNIASDSAKDSEHCQVFRIYEQPFFEGFESFLRTN